MAKAKRISGQDMESKAGMEYAVEQGEKWHIDLGAIQERIDAYIAEAAESGRYSISGLCIKLGITREALRLWRMGYVNTADEQIARVLPKPRSDGGGSKSGAICAALLGGVRRVQDAEQAHQAAGKRGCDGECAAARTLHRPTTWDA